MGLTAAAKECKAFRIYGTLNKECLTRIQDITVINRTQSLILAAVRVPDHERRLGIQITGIEIAGIRVTYQVPGAVLLIVTQVLLKFYHTVITCKKILTGCGLNDRSYCE